MSLTLKKLAKALKVDTEFSDEDINILEDLRYDGCEDAEEEIYSQKILQRISELVEKVDNCLVIKDINEELPFESDVKTDNEIFANWCKDFMNEIKEIAKEKYPNVTCWCDTGSDYNVIMAMLEQFRKDL